MFFSTKQISNFKKFSMFLHSLNTKVKYFIGKQYLLSKHKNYPEQFRML